MLATYDWCEFYEVCIPDNTGRPKTERAERREGEEVTANDEVLTAIQEMIDRGPSNEELLAGWVQDYGSGDPELADDIARTVAAFWD